MAGYGMLHCLTLERKGTGYGTFKFQMSLLLNRDTSLKLATFFEFPPADYDVIKESGTPGLDFVRMIDAKDIITDHDDSVIVDALERIDMCGIARRVKKLFTEHIKKIPTSYGYGTLKFQMSLLLNRDTSLKLATFFEFPPTDYDVIKESETPGLDFVRMIDAKDIITEHDDSAIVDALKRIDMSGIARRVKQLFAEHIKKMPTSYDDVEFNRWDYPFLEDEQFYNDHNTKELLDILNENARQVMESRLERYTLPCNDDVISVRDERQGGELRIAVVGKTGQGKSATANTILGIGAFDTDDTANSVTKYPSRRSSLFDGRKIYVVDTPGLKDTDRKEERILREICRIPMLLEKGVHAFVYVFNGADPQFGEEDLGVLENIQEAFGTDFTKYCLVLFTRADSTLKRKPFTEFLQKQKESPEFKTFLDKVDWRILAMENSATSLAEKRWNQSSVVSLVDKIVSQNVQDGRSEVYTNEMFKIAQKEKQRTRMRSKARGWGEEVYEATEGANAVFGEASHSDQEYFHQVRVRLPSDYSEALQSERGEKDGFLEDGHLSGKNKQLKKKLESTRSDKSFQKELTSEMKQQQEDFESLRIKLWRWLMAMWIKIKGTCVIL